MASLSLIAAFAAVGAPAAQAVTCTTTVASNGDIQTAINGVGQNAIICLNPGTNYIVPASITFTSPTNDGDTLITDSTNLAKIACGSVSHSDPCVNLSGSNGITLKQIIVKNSNFVDINLGVNSVIDTVTVQCAAEVGITANRVSTGAIVEDSFVKYNPADEAGTSCPNPPTLTCADWGGDGHRGGLKSNASADLHVLRTHFNDNGGGAALWFDVGSHGSTPTSPFVVSNNTVQSNNINTAAGTDGIRIEISCYGSVQGNTVDTSAGTQIDLVNSDNILVGGGGTYANTVDAGATDGIRLLGSNRVSDPITVPPSGNSYCANSSDPSGSGYYWHTYSNLIQNNVVTVDSGGTNGMNDVSGLNTHNGFGPGVVFNNVWKGNDYTLIGSQTCSGNALWKFPNAPSTSPTLMTWPNWIGTGMGQGNEENTGAASCTP